MAKFLFFMAVFAGAAYAVWRIAPPAEKSRAESAMAAAGLFQNPIRAGTDFLKTLPEYARRKLSVPESGSLKRQRLLGELTEKFDALEEEIQNHRPAEKGLPGAQASFSKNGAAKKLLEESREKLSELKNADDGESIFPRAAARIAGAILPAPTGSPDQARCPSP